MKPTKEMNVRTLLDDLDAGVFEQRVAAALAEVASAVVHHGREGKVVIEFGMKRITTTSQIEVTHKLTFQQPTTRGRLTEDAVGETPMHVGPGGVLSIVPIAQGDFGFERPGAPTTPRARIGATDED